MASLHSKAEHGSAPAARDDGREASPAWNGAFYRFSEAIRKLSHGAINYKMVYGLVGIRGRYINHVNPAIRKRTAAYLSRLMHSIRYAADLVERYEEDPEVFEKAGLSLAGELREKTRLSEGELVEFFLTDAGDEVLEGLKGEAGAGRQGLDFDRMERERMALKSWADAVVRQGASPLADIIASQFSLMALGGLGRRFARVLVPATPVEPASASDRARQTERERSMLAAPSACIARLSAMDGQALLGLWSLDADRPFTIGRGIDCDVVESYPLVSRLHCRIYRFGDSWYLQDVDSRHGTRILRSVDAGGSSVAVDTGDGPCVAFDSRQNAGAPAGMVARLEYGDVIELAGLARFAFKRLAESCRVNRV